MTPRPSKKPKRSLTYAQSGVDIAEGDALVDFLKKANPNIGGFGALAPIPKSYKQPRLVMATDGVGNVGIGTSINIKMQIIPRAKATSPRKILPNKALARFPAVEDALLLACVSAMMGEV